MNPLALAQKYMEVVFSGENLDELHDIFADDLSFRGPLYEFNSAEEYIRSLQSAPPKDFKYRIIDTFEDESSALLLYEFSKPGISVTMAQFFGVRDEKIANIRLIFDTSAFRNS